MEVSGSVHEYANKLKAEPEALRAERDELRARVRELEGENLRLTCILEKQRLDTNKVGDNTNDKE